MPEPTNISASLACGHWEALVPDALEGRLTSVDEAAFFAHLEVCPACTALFEDARRGREWLEFLAPEPEIPAGLVDRILARTGPGQPSAPVSASVSVSDPAVATAVGTALSIPAWQRPGFYGRVRRYAEPRLMMTAAMAFFSLALTLNLTGVRLGALRLGNLRPSNLRGLVERRLTMASTPIVRYYDHLRLVYEFQSTMRELRRGSQGESSSDDTIRSPRRNSAPEAPGESKRSPGRRGGDLRFDLPEESGNLSPDGNPVRNQPRPAGCGDSAMAIRERNSKWIA